MTDAPLSERRQLWLFAALQLTLLLDFMIVMPLGPQLMQAFAVSTSEFGLLVSAYTFASAAMGLLGVMWVDRFAKRTLLLWLYAAFVVATLSCALAPNAAVLLGGRVVAGGAAGLLWAVVMALIVDTVPERRRGGAIGLVMSAYAVSAVAGVPAGLWLASAAGFRAPFGLVTALSTVIWLLSRSLVRGPAPSTTSGEGGARQLLRAPGLRLGWLLTFLVVSAGFLLIPFLGTFMVGTLALSQRQLSLVYLCGGAATFFTSRVVGWLVDRFGARKVLSVLLGGSVAPHLIFTHLSRASFVNLTLLFVVFMTITSGRMIPTTVLITARVPAALRGRYLAVNTAASDLAAGLATWIGGGLVTRTNDGRLLGFERAGLAAVTLSVLALTLLWAWRWKSEGEEGATLLPNTDGAA